MIGWMADDFSNAVTTADVGSFGSALASKLSDKAYMQAYRKAFEQAYGKEVADTQVANLKHLSTLAKRMETTEIEPTAGVQHIGQLSKSPILDKLGFTASTVMSLVRAIVTGRSSEYHMATILGGQYGIKEVTRIRNAVIAESLKNPESLQHILTIAKSGPQDTGAMQAAKAFGREVLAGMVQNIKALPKQTKDVVPAVVGTIETQEANRQIKE